MDTAREIGPLTGLRGVAALYVVMFHYFHSIGYASHFATFVSHGYLAVDLFFCLSGFVMALSYGHMFEGRGSSRAYIRLIGCRIARIYPLYACATTAAAVLILCDWLDFENGGGVSLSRTYLLNLAMVQVWGLASSVDVPAWSISAEWAAYLVFPLLLPLAIRSRPATAWLTAAACMMVILSLPMLRIADGHQPSPHALLDISRPHLALPVLRCLAEFTLGMFAYRIAGTKAGELIASSRWAAPVALGVTFALLTMVDTDVAVVLMFTVCIITLTTESSLPARWLASYPAQIAGRLSYSVYLVHALFFRLAGWVHGKASALGLAHGQTYGTLVCLALTLSIAPLLYAFIEVPGRRVIRHALDGRRRVTGNDLPLAVAKPDGRPLE